MHTRISKRWLLAIPLSFFLGCSTPPATKVGLLHLAHRQSYSLKAQELRNLQAYISTDVLAQYEDATGKRSILVSRGTPGVVTDVGPDWLKVSFREGGIDVPFVMDRTKKDSWYWLATAVEGRKRFKIIKELSEKVFLHEGTRYSLVYGAAAHLLVDWMKNE